MLLTGTYTVRALTSWGGKTLRQKKTFEMCRPELFFLVNLFLKHCTKLESRYQGPTKDRISLKCTKPGLMKQRGTESGQGEVPFQESLKAKVSVVYFGELLMGCVLSQTESSVTTSTKCPSARMH